MKNVCSICWTHTHTLHCPVQYTWEEEGREKKSTYHAFTKNLVCTPLLPLQTSEGPFNARTPIFIQQIRIYTQPRQEFRLNAEHEYALEFKSNRCESLLHFHNRFIFSLPTQ